MLTTILANSLNSDNLHSMILEIQSYTFSIEGKDIQERADGNTIINTECKKEEIKNMPRESYEAS